MKVKLASTLDVIESAYRTEGSDEEWMERAARALTAGTPGAVVAWGYTLHKGGAATKPIPDAFLTAFQVKSGLFSQIYSGLDTRISEVVSGAGTRCMLLTEAVTEPRGVRRRAGPTRFLKQVGGDDALAVLSLDASGAGVLVACVTEGYTLSEERREVGRRVGVHLASGFRLRRALLGRDPLDRAEAVFEADGRLASAQGRAQQSETTQRLRHAIDRIERARAGPVRKNDIEALDLWQGLVEGRWSVVHHYDSDGRRYHLAMANPPLAVFDRALIEIEAEVAAMVIAGESNKVIAYSLGIAESTVANHITHALKKLGVRSRIELIRLAATLGVRDPEQKI